LLEGLGYACYIHIWENTLKCFVHALLIPGTSLEVTDASHPLIRISARPLGSKYLK
jgi:hypothetical protein